MAPLFPRVVLGPGLGVRQAQRGLVGPLVPDLPVEVEDGLDAQSVQPGWRCRKGVREKDSTFMSFGTPIQLCLGDVEKDARM